MMNLPEGAKEPLQALLQQADSVSVAQYTIPRPVSDQEFFTFYQQAARTGGWQPVLENALRPGSPLVIYQPPDRGVLVLRGDSPAARAGGVPPAMSLTAIQLQGVIDVRKAMPAGRPNDLKAVPDRSP